MSDSGGPGASKKRGASWTSKLYQKHKNKFHSNVSEEEIAPLLAADNNNIENQPVQQEQRSSRKRILDSIRKRTTPILAGFAILLAMTLIGISIGWAIDRRGHTRQSFCLSRDCSDAAARIFENLAPNYPEIDPCTNFQQFACGGFQEYHKLRPDQSRVGTLSIMAEENQQTLRHVLEKKESEIQAKDRANFKKLKADYDACMDEKKIKSYGLAPLRIVTEHVKAKYPVATSLRPLRKMSQLNIRPTVKDITDAIVYMTSIGVESVLQFYVGADDKHPDDEVIFVGPPGRVGLPSKEYYKNKKLVADYQAMMSKVLPHFFDAHSNETFSIGQSRQGARLSTADIISGVVSFEMKLAEARPDEEDLEDPLKAYNPRSISELQQLVPELAPNKILRALAPTGYTAKHVIVSSPSYLQNMSDIVDATPKEIVQAYLVWKTVQAYSSRVEDPDIEPLRRFFNQLEGKEPDAREERWRTCVRSCDNTLGWMLSKFYVDQAFSPKDKQFGDQIIDDIKDSFVVLLRDAHWMEQSVRDIAEKKVAAIDKKIGYPVSNPDILDAKALEKYYALLKISADTHFQNGLDSAQFEVNMDWGKLGKPTRHDEWGMSAPTVNAYYSPPGNEIVFPAGIMQGPVFYGPDVPPYLTYGAFAAVAGHELSHGFDNNGAEYDETGRLRNWWTKETKAAFDKKTSCFVDQYGKYAVVGPDNTTLHINGKLTLGENVADAGGLHAAFKSWDKRGRPGQIMPVLANFTKEQTFFLSYANAWCGFSTPEAAAQGIYRDPHSPPAIRILIDASNMTSVSVTALPLLNPKASKDHHVGSPPTSFVNPWPSFDSTNTSPLKAFQAKFSRHKPPFVPVPENREGLVHIRKPDFGKDKDGLKATWIGHASFLLETTASKDADGKETGLPGGRGVRILCDPVWSERTSPSQWIGPKRYSPVPCSLQEVCELGVDVVVISHDHYDHLDVHSIKEIHRLRGRNVVFLTGLGNAQWFHRQGIPAAQVREMDWWDGCEIKVKDVGSVKLYCTPTQHFSGRSIFDRGKTLWCSWAIIETTDSAKRCFFAGDTGYRSWPEEKMDPEQLQAIPRCPAFKDIGERLGPFDLSFLPIGLCTPRTFMSNVHCSPFDTVDLHKDIKSRKSVGMHYGTVRGGLSGDYEDVKDPPRWWKQASEQAGLAWGEETLLIDIGETIVA